MYAQVRRMRIISASLIQDPTRDKYNVCLSDGINNLSLVDVVPSAGPVKVGSVMRVTIEPVNEATGR